MAPRAPGLEVGRRREYVLVAAQAAPGRKVGCDAIETMWRVTGDTARAATPEMALTAELSVVTIIRPLGTARP
jgi:hypothetical protein